MCLYITNKEPKVAEQDIVVLKYLTRGNNYFYTPHRNTPVKLDRILTAYPSILQISEYKVNNSKTIYALQGGAIHARLLESEIYCNELCYKAIIPKGVKYWIDPFGTEIAATRLLITSKPGSNSCLDTSFFESILQKAPEINGIRIGDYQLTDNSFAHPSKKLKQKKVRGIVCGFHSDTNKPLICALDCFKEMWDRNNSSVTYFNSNPEAQCNFNGKIITNTYKNSIFRGKSRFYAFERCLSYRKKQGEKGQWYFGSFEEVKIMLENIIYLNAAHHITNFGFLYDTNDRYWSCSENFSRGSLYCNVYAGIVRYDYYQKRGLFKVVPFFAI